MRAVGIRNAGARAVKGEVQRLKLWREGSAEVGAVERGLGAEVRAVDREGDVKR